MQKKRIIKAIIFVLIFAAVFIRLNWFVQPVWLDWSNYDSLHGFYEQPEDTIETIFLGASITVNGVIPMELYEKYGICSYNLGTEQQPMLASYYWLEEAYRKHGATLKNVMLDVSMLRRNPRSSFYQKALDAMHLSPVKYNAYRDYTGSFWEALSYLLPICEYHSRWTALEQSDFEKQDYTVRNYLRGYNFKTNLYFDAADKENLFVPDYYLDEDAAAEEMEEDALNYLDRMVDFCREHDIKLTLMKIPAFIDMASPAWASSAHNAVAKLAEKYDLEFYDFNFLPYVDEIAYNNVVNSSDGVHMNYSGATKFTDWVGRYLTQECDSADIRGEANYEFMEDELADYHKYVTDVVELKNIADPAEYIQAAVGKPNRMVFISVKDDGEKALTDEQREAFAACGLTALSEITYRSSYIAVIQDGEVSAEKIDFWDENASGKGKSISVKGAQEDTAYKVVSGGKYLGNTSSIKIDDTEYSLNKRGINIVVYDYADDAVLDAASFDTYAAPERAVNTVENLEAHLQAGASYAELPDGLKQLYLYIQKCEKAKKAGGQ